MESRFEVRGGRWEGGREGKCIRGRATVPVTSLEGAMGVLLYGIVGSVSCFSVNRYWVRYEVVWKWDFSTRSVKRSASEFVDVDPGISCSHAASLSCVSVYLT